MRPPLLAIIGGSGLNSLNTLQNERYEVMRTPYGEISSPLLFGRWRARDVLFMARHGRGHTIQPHKVNYRANMWALKEAGADKVLSVASVGAIHPDLAPGTLVFPDQILDYTWGREHTFHDQESEVTHIDFTEPYDENFRQELIRAAQTAHLAITTHGVYAAVNGPRLETAAEIRRLARDGAQMVGMTGMPEAALARELHLPYATVAIVSNWAAGTATNSRTVAIEEMRHTIAKSLDQIYRLLDSFCSSQQDPS